VWCFFILVCFFFFCFPFTFSIVFLIYKDITAVHGAEFVTRNGSQLYYNGSPFRFSGTNIYWLGLDENVGGVAYPTTFRVDDALETAKEMGAAVVRAHTLGVSTGNKLSYETGLSTFNNEALTYIDYAIYRAGVLGIKLIIPFTDNYKYYHGGKHDFTDWRKISDENQFYTNANVISDFKDFINHLLLHQNQHTRLTLRDDPTILAWETGNEIKPPTSWTQEIAKYIKSVDRNHLVLDGTYGITQSSLDIPEVDIYSDHFYPMDVQKLTSDAQLVKQHNKVFFVGEYAWTGSTLSQFLSALESQAVAGDTSWSLFPHLDTYGFVKHNDGFTLHYPGDTQTMQQQVQQLRAHAYKMLGKAVPTPSLPPSPVITTLRSGSIAWRGSVGASNYSVEASTATNGPWDVLCNQCTTDNNLPWSNSRIVSNQWYRVRPYNINNQAGSYSEAVKF